MKRILKNGLYKFLPFNGVVSFTISGKKIQYLLVKKDIDKDTIQYIKNNILYPFDIPQIAVIIDEEGKDHPIYGELFGIWGRTTPYKRVRIDSEILLTHQFKTVREWAKNKLSLCR